MLTQETFWQNIYELGGFLSDQVGVKAPWFGGVVIGALAVGAFWMLDKRNTREDY